MKRVPGLLLGACENVAPPGVAGMGDVFPGRAPGSERAIASEPRA